MFELLLLIAVFLVLCLHVAVSIYTLFYVRRRHHMLFDEIAELKQGVRAFIWDTVNLVAALGPRVPLPRPGGWAASADLLVELSTRVIQEQPRLVVELGSGLSTIVTALMLREIQGARLVSIDHDTDYALRTRSRLADHHLSECVEVRAAPLVETTEFGRPMLWYDTRRLGDLVGIDLLVVDGPPLPVAADVRYPSLPFFWGRLRPGACVILDDTIREEERAIVERWRREFPGIEVQQLDLEKGAVVIRKPA
jgi:methyltransferase family protein